MCIAIYKPVGNKMPSKKIFSNCFSNNDDGAGFMFPYNGKVHYEKGFMSFSAFKNALKNAIKTYNINTVQTPMVFHFRISTQGGVVPALTHPFPITRNYDEMRKLKGDVDFAVVHNGVIDFASSYYNYEQVKHNDTMEFTSEVIFPLVFGNPKYYENAATIRLIEYLLGSNRFVIMNGDGHTQLFGEWTKSNGVFYSNNSFSYKKQKTWNYSKSTNSGYFSQSYGYGDNDGYDVCDDDGYGYDGSTAGYDGKGQYRWNGRLSLTEEQKADFIKTGVLKCECGKPLYIGWDKEHSTTVGICDCGEEYFLDWYSENIAFKNNLVNYTEEDLKDPFSSNVLKNMIYRWSKDANLTEAQQSIKKQVLDHLEKVGAN